MEQNAVIGLAIAFLGIWSLAGFPIPKSDACQPYKHQIEVLNAEIKGLRDGALMNR